MKRFSDCYTELDITWGVPENLRVDPSRTMRLQRCQINHIDNTCICMIGRGWLGEVTARHRDAAALDTLLACFLQLQRIPVSLVLSLNCGIPLPSSCGTGDGYPVRRSITFGY